jgi:hypothetical protein
MPGSAAYRFAATGFNATQLGLGFIKQSGAFAFNSTNPFN